MDVTRKSTRGLTRRVLALAFTLALAPACSGDDDDGGNGGGGNDAGTGEPVTLSGTVTYDFVPAVYSPSSRRGTLDFARVSSRPVRNAVVQVRQGTRVVGNGVTDEQGHYSLTYTPSGTGNLTVVALAKTTTPEIQIEDNTDNNAIWGVGNTLTGSETSKDLHATHGWSGSSYTASRRVAAPFAILDSMYTASQAFLEARPVDFPLLKVNWSPNNVPQSGRKELGQIGTSHFSFSENEIYVLGREGVDTDEFDAHVIVHEWGHYFEANLARADSPGGPHSSGDVLDPRLAFGEGYGNALASIILPEPIYADTYWDGSTLNAFGFDAESEPTPTTDDPRRGSFSEMSVFRLLYDLHDSGNSEAHDRVSYDIGILYDVLVGPQKATPALTTIGSFINGLKAQPGVNAADVDTLLDFYGIGSITSDFGDGDAPLRSIYTNVTYFPFNADITLRGGTDYNKRQQNQYFVFNGTGRTMTFTASHPTEDVGIEVYHRGEVIGSADRYLSGTETFSAATQADEPYVLVLVGFSDTAANYTPSLSITSQ
ncbi:carboxypeptidase-like regulatory domain-containing protein [Myxococcus sp. Y35]|uniref:carboxypeptidase-like regulatory domain-containing protein n=1 Tax=Pseudomyxococcus flavus TaxID=3115648 RepID=UPI003CF66309